MAKQYNPNFTETNYDSIRDGMKAYVKTDAPQALAFNTATHHLGMLNEAIDALNNGDIKALNKIATFYKVQTGNPAPQVFQGIRNAVSGELSKMFKGSAATDSEIDKNNETLDRTDSPKVLKPVVNSYLGLMDGKLKALKYKVDQQTQGHLPPTMQLVEPAAQQIFDKLKTETETDKTPAKGGAFKWGTGAVVVKPNGG